MDHALMQASKKFPQLKEHALQMKCQPSTELGQFMRNVLSKKSASSYDNVIATTSWVQDDEEEEDKIVAAV